MNPTQKTRCRNFRQVFLLLANLFSLLIFSTVAISQDLNNFERLVSQDPIPADFTTVFLEKLEQDRGEITATSSTERKSHDKFYQQSNYYLTELLLSGRVLFNDPVSRYVERVANNILEFEPSLQGKLRFYTIKSTYVNAITTNQGVIFVNAGLISQLENEAQLAYILCHEMVHFKNNHVLDSYVESQRIEAGQDLYRNTSNYDKLLAKSAFSREHEMEADREGLDLFLKTGYSPEAIHGVFDVLQYSYLPIDEVPFDKSFFETEEMKFPNSEYALEEVAEVSVDDDYDDTKSTHPNIRKRREALIDRVLDAPTAGKQAFLVSEAEFRHVRNLARFELSRLYVLKRDYGNAIYHNWLMLSEFPNNRFLRISMGKALYNLAHYKNHGYQYDVLSDYVEVEGQSQQLFYFLSKLTKDDLCVIATNYVWQLKADFPDDADIATMADGMLREIVVENELKPDDFHRAPVMDTLVAVPDSADIDWASLNKYEKLRMQRKLKQKAEGLTTTGNAKPYSNGFVELLKNNAFASRFAELVAENDVPEESYTERRERQKLEQKERKRLRKKGYALGVEKLVILDPLYLDVDLRKKDKLSFLRSEQGAIDLTDALKSSAEKVELDLVLLDGRDIQFDDIDRFNDMALLTDWLNERLDHEEIENLTMAESAAVSELSKKYGTSDFGWMGLITVSSSDKQQAWMYCIYSIYLPILLPLAIYKAVAPSVDSYFYMFVYDLTTGEKKMAISEVRKFGRSVDQRRSKVYDFIHQVKSQPKVR